MKKVIHPSKSLCSFVLVLYSILGILTSCGNPVEPPRPQADYWISPQGRVGAAGTYEDPFSSPEDAALLCKGGELVMFRKGTYTGDWTLIDRDFPSPVVFRGEPDTWVDGENLRSKGFTLIGCSNIEIHDLGFRNFTAAGVEVMFGSQIILDSLRVQDCGRGTHSSKRNEEGYGINAKYSDQVRIQDCTVEACGPGPERVAQGILGTGINTYLLTRSLISGNLSKNNIGGGLLVEDGFQVTAKGNILEKNRGIAPLPYGGTWTCGGIWVDGGEAITLSENTLSGNRIGLYITDLDCQGPEQYLLEKNRLQGNDVGLEVLGLGLTGPQAGILELQENVWSSNTLDQHWDGESWGIPFETEGISVLGELAEPPRVLFNPGTAFFSAEAVFKDGTRLSVVQEASWDFTHGRDFLLQNSLSGISSILFIRLQKGHEVYEAWYDTNSSETPFQVVFEADGQSPGGYTLNSASGSELYRWGYPGSMSTPLPPGTLINLDFLE